jgi:hypothetical protein
MRLCTLRLASAEDGAKATSLDAALGEHAPWCRTTPAALLIHIKPLTWSKTSRGEARLVGCPLGLEQRTARDSDGGSD